MDQVVGGKYLCVVHSFFYWIACRWSIARAEGGGQGRRVQPSEDTFRLPSWLGALRHSNRGLLFLRLRSAEYVKYTLRDFSPK
jgi:hypothetical protein